MLDQETGFSTITEYLSDDHRRLDRVIDDICAMVEDGEVERAEYSFRDLDAGLRRHIRVEEELLFPVFDARAGLIGPTKVMRLEHRHIESLLAELATALADGRGPAASTALTALTQLLGDHNRKEEHILYPRSDAALNDDERRALIQKMAR
jgi:iron-sulfur cluster repair protein YtfE (RIC family)